MPSKTHLLLTKVSCWTFHPEYDSFGLAQKERPASFFNLLGFGRKPTLVRLLADQLPFALAVRLRLRIFLPLNLTCKLTDLDLPGAMLPSETFFLRNLSFAPLPVRVTPEAVAPPSLRTLT